MKAGKFPLFVRTRACCFALFLSLGASVTAKEQPSLLYEATIPPYPVPIIIDAKVADENRRLMLDTGATYSALDESMKSILGAPQGTRDVQHLTGKTTLPIYEAPHISIGASGKLGELVTVLDLRRVQAIAGESVAGVLGSDALKQLVLDVDYDAGKLRLTRHADPKVEQMAWVPLTEVRGNPALNITLGEESHDLTIDLGSNDHLQFSDTAFSRLKEVGFIEEKEAAGVVSLGGLGTQRTGIFTKGNLLGFDLTGTRVTASGEKNTVGRGFLIRFNFIIDIAKGRFYYQQNAIKRVPNPHREMGLVLVYHEGDGVVIAVKPDGPGDKAGFRKGDIVKKLGSVSSGQFTEAGIFHLCELNRGQELEAQIVRGNESLQLKLQLEN